LSRRFFNTKSIILNSIRFGEGHKIVNIYTEEMGKIEASAFGARKTKSRFGSKLEPFTSTRLILYRKNEESMYSIKEVEVINYNDSIRSDLCRIVVANSIIEPVVKFVERAQRDTLLYRLLKDSLSVLNQIPPKKGIYLLCMFDIQFFSIMGYTPDFTMCNRCEKVLEGEKVFFDSTFGLPLCGKCITRDSFMFEDSTIRFIKWSMTNPIFISPKITMNINTLFNLRRAIEGIYRYTFHKGLQSWEQLNELYLHYPIN